VHASTIFKGKEKRICPGGRFGTMPAFAADYFGAKNVGAIYGLVLTT
jgi:hypothetical protein